MKINSFEQTIQGIVAATNEVSNNEVAVPIMPMRLVDWNKCQNGKYL